MELFYRKQGSGPVVVVVHGLYGSSDNWLNMGKSLPKNIQFIWLTSGTMETQVLLPAIHYEDMKDDLAIIF
jgi:esterase